MSNYINKGQQKHFRQSSGMIAVRGTIRERYRWPFLLPEYVRLMRAIFICIYFLSLSLSAVAQAKTPMMQDIERAFDKGDFARISSYLGKVTSLTINDVEASYSGSQAEMVLKDFFRRNRVSDFKVMHTGESGNKSSTFMIGRLYTTTGIYRVYLHFKLREKSGELQDIRLDR